MKAQKAPDIYRGISIISCVDKVYPALINERLTKFVGINKIIDKRQKSKFFLLHNQAQHNDIVMLLIVWSTIQAEALTCDLLNGLLTQIGSKTYNHRLRLVSI